MSTISSALALVGVSRTLAPLSEMRDIISKVSIVAVQGMSRILAPLSEMRDISKMGKMKMATVGVLAQPHGWGNLPQNN